MTLNLSTGFTNSSLYSGQIEYVDLAATESYWILSLACKFTLSYVKSMSQRLQLLRCKVHRLPFRQDLPPTLLSTPEQHSLAAQATSSPKYMPRFQAPKQAVGTFRVIIHIVRNAAAQCLLLRANRSISFIACSTNVEVAVSFGNGTSLPISSADFKLSQLTSSSCLGSFFVLDSSSGSTPSWIFGDTFLVSYPLLTLRSEITAFVSNRKTSILFSVITLLRLGLLNSRA